MKRNLVYILTMRVPGIFDTEIYGVFEHRNDAVKMIEEFKKHDEERVIKGWQYNIEEHRIR